MGHLADPTVLDALLVALLTAATGVATVIVRRLVRFLRRFGHMVTDWTGHPADPRRGIEERKPFPERMDTVEALVLDLVHDSRRNGGVAADPTGRIVDGTSKDINSEALELLRRIDARIPPKDEL